MLSGPGDFLKFNIVHKTKQFVFSYRYTLEGLCCLINSMCVILIGFIDACIFFCNITEIIIQAVTYVSGVSYFFVFRYKFINIYVLFFSFFL